MLGPSGYPKLFYKEEAVLRLRWKRLGSKEYYTVASARRLFPEVAARFRRLAEKLSSPEAVAHLAKLAYAEVQRRRAGEPEHLVRTVSVSDFGSQGYGAEGYAECLAAASVEALRRNGISARAIRDSVGVFAIQAAVPKELLRDLETSESLERLPVRDFVKFCWKRGCQPRVFFPFLPVGYEEKAGLDYFGNELEIA